MSTFTATAYPVREENEAIAIVRTEIGRAHV